MKLRLVLSSFWLACACFASANLINDWYALSGNASSNSTAGYLNPVANFLAVGYDEDPLGGSDWLSAYARSVNTLLTESGDYDPNCPLPSDPNDENKAATCYLSDGGTAYFAGYGPGPQHEYSGQYPDDVYIRRRTTNGNSIQVIWEGYLPGWPNVASLPVDSAGYSNAGFFRYYVLVQTGNCVVVLAYDANLVLMNWWRYGLLGGGETYTAHGITISNGEVYVSGTYNNGTGDKVWVAKHNVYLSQIFSVTDNLSATGTKLRVSKPIVVTSGVYVPLRIGTTGVRSFAFYRLVPSTFTWSRFVSSTLPVLSYTEEPKGLAVLNTSTPKVYISGRYRWDDANGPGTLGWDWVTRKYELINGVWTQTGEVLDDPVDAAPEEEGAVGNYMTAAGTDVWVGGYRNFSAGVNAQGQFLYDTHFVARKYDANLNPVSQSDVIVKSNTPHVGKAEGLYSRLNTSTVHMLVFGKANDTAAAAKFHD